jgi:hypothetical protein
MFRHLRFRFVAVGVVLGLLGAVPAWRALAAADDAASPVVASRIQAHVNYLASPAMKGRGTGTPELDRAANYIAEHFRKARLAAPDGKSYFQKFSVTVGASMGKANEAATLRGETPEPLKPAQDYIPLNISDSGDATLALAFMGYGISSEEHKYDDYLHMDAQDKAVIVLRHEPQENDEKSPFAGRELTTYAHIVNKAINAKMHGARAMILVNDPAPHPGEEDDLVKFGTLAGPENAGILLIQAKREVVDAWLAPSGKTLAQLQQAIDEKLQPQSFYIPDAKVRLRVDLQRKTATTQNVIGVLHGSDPKLAEEAVVIGAHYDHLGLGERNSLAPSQAGQVHAGADDNASGAAALLELAQVLGARRKELKRSLVFIAFSGEELGLLGSAYYTKNPAWPLERTAAMINLDMVGRPRDNKLYVNGVGTSPGFKQLLEQANAGSFQLSYSESGYGSSDHTSFYIKGVPVIFFFSGLHSDYHKPSDLPERILTADHARVVELAFRTAEALTNLPERPQFVRVQEPRPAGSGGGTGYGAYFGSIPDMGEEVEGVKFADIRDGSPAAQAGLKAGDILVEFAGKPIKNLYDFTYALRAHKPGEEVQVTVLRGKERLTVSVTLARRN